MYQMKILRFIFSFYIILLSGVYCSDAYEPVNDAVEVLSAHGADHHAGCNAEICSPFCSCSCSTGFVRSWLMHVEEVSAPSGPLLAFYFQKDYFSEKSPLFQPPRLG